MFYQKMFVIDMIEFLSSKHKKLMDENTIYYVLLKMFFLLYYFISLNFKCHNPPLGHDRRTDYDFFSLASLSYTQ